MSAHGKENGKEPDWVGLSRNADGQTEQRGSESGQGSNASPLTPFMESRESPSKCYCSVCLIFCCSQRPC